MTVIDYIVLTFTKIFQLPLFDGEAIQAFSHPDPERTERILDALELQQTFEDLEDVLEDEPIN